MNGEARVWVATRPLVSGKRSYRLRWICPIKHRWDSRPIGNDRKRAEREAAKLEGELNAGTYAATRKISWDAFVEDHVTKIDGEMHADTTKRILTEFGEVTRVSEPTQVSYPMVEQYVAWMSKKGLAPSTINKHLTYLTTAMIRAVKRGYAGKNWVDSDFRKTVDKKEIRVLSADEEPRLMNSATDLYGEHMATLIRFALRTWGRTGEVLTLSWKDVLLDDGSLHFRSTKSHEDRFIPLDPSTGIVDELRRLQAKTMQDGGPFKAFRNRSALRKKWLRIVADAKIVPHITVHDLRRTGITRALLGNMPPVAVMKMAGHKNLTTTMRYYTRVDQRDLREALRRMNKRVAG